ncbi:MAG: hypothetical protein ACI4TS_03130, partial [Bacteroidaceae bacterium]
MTTIPLNILSNTNVTQKADTSQEVSAFFVSYKIIFSRQQYNNNSEKLNLLCVEGELDADEIVLFPHESISTIIVQILLERVFFATRAHFSIIFAPKILVSSGENLSIS